MEGNGFFPKHLKSVTDVLRAVGTAPHNETMRHIVREYLEGQGLQGKSIKIPNEVFVAACRHAKTELEKKEPR